MNKVREGRMYESAAAEMLVRRGYEILERNYRYHQAEIDIIARDGKYIVFVEVKYRRDGVIQHPLEAVDVRKQRQVSRAAAGYLHQHGMNTGQPCRFDVCAFTGSKAEYYEDAFPYTS